MLQRLVTQCCNAIDVYYIRLQFRVLVFGWVGMHRKIMPEFNVKFSIEYCLSCGFVGAHNPSQPQRIVGPGHPLPPMLSCHHLIEFF